MSCLGKSDQRDRLVEGDDLGAEDLAGARGGLQVLQGIDDDLAADPAAQIVSQLSHGVVAVDLSDVEVTVATVPQLNRATLAADFVGSHDSELSLKSFETAEGADRKGGGGGGTQTAILHVNYLKILGCPRVISLY